MALIKKTIFLLLVGCLVMGIGLLEVRALTLPDPLDGGSLLFPDSTAPVALPYGDFWSYSLPILAYFEDVANGGGTGPGNPYYVNSTPGAIKDGIVIATGAGGVPVTTNADGMDDAYATPNGVGGSPLFSTGVEPDPGGSGEFTGDIGETWDIKLSALSSYLNTNQMILFFNNNQQNPTVENQSLQNLLAWGQLRIVDEEEVLDPIYLDFTNSNNFPASLPPPPPDPLVFPDGLGGYVSPGEATSEWPYGDPSGFFPDGPNAFPLSGPLQDIVLSGGPVTFDYWGGMNPVQVTIDHNLGANQAAYAITSPEIDNNLGAWIGTGYDTMQIDLRFAGLNNGYEQLFILRGEDVVNVIPEPTTMLLLGTGLLGLVGLGRKKFLKKG